MKNLLSIFILQFSLYSQGSNFNLQERIEISSYYKDSYAIVYGDSSYSDLGEFKKSIQKLDREKKKEAKALVDELSSIIPTDFLRPIIYWKVISPNQRNLSQTLAYIMTYKANILRDSYQSPLVSSEEKEKVKKIITKIYHRKDITENNFYDSLINDFRQKSNLISSFSDLKNFILAIKETKPISYSLQEGLKISPYTLSFSGLIPGNQVEIFNKNATDKERIDWYLNQENKDLTEMPKTKHGQGHIAFKTDPIFIKVKEMIVEAKESIFISVRIIDGTLGMTVMKYLLRETEKKLSKNSNFKVFILVQEETQTLEYLKLETNLRVKLRNNVFLVKTFDEERENNSKLIVIDANTEEPQALVGSKNWSDHSGGYFFDNDIWIKGPAAALLQSNFYSDFETALLKSSQYLNNSKNILDTFKIRRDSYPLLGDEVVRLAESSLDGKIKNTRNIVIDMIRNAKSHIYMEQLYLYDSYIINALIKRKLEVPKLDIRILADHNSNVGLNGLPNTIYLRELNLYNIEVKARKTTSSAKNLPNGELQIYHQENHRNTLSIDGKTLLTGSASLSPNSQEGNTREIGVQIFDKKSIRNFENNFLLTWNDRNKVMDLDIQNFRATIDNSSLSKEISSLINAIASSLIKAKDELKKKF
ncbi:phosphatidylserine/phosphatidylglycerophosphate/cardiolipin synthase family protein [Halobacteriovorax sp. JY17]|uniref:phospholipase D-like domain-containing protein n=1 Tax=Halobacteriovorax sp. JY17 TaxID=2014617 RepID=UPI000C58F89A|nr:phosphatidylserine/phosphatidylglycerophosphate/cardiolipin synthase family protein [Halobacteriovorax sp. JY17]PIK16437.1 MAG: hypothetical protein CES88_06770 [Halobacteriovorax sp. JY17]